MDIERRKFFKGMGFGALGMAAVPSMFQNSAVLEEGGFVAKEEIKKLKEAYEMLDARTKLVVKLVLAATGIDFVSDAALILSEL
jgi:hypothetical protein